MITIDEKDYKLNDLIHFEMLQEILIKLSKNQTELITEVELMKRANQERDIKISELERSLKESNDKSNRLEEEQKKEDINIDINQNQSENINTEIIKTEENIIKNYNQIKDNSELQKSIEMNK